MRLQNRLTSLATYLAVIFVALYVSTGRIGAQGDNSSQNTMPAASASPARPAKPYFSLSTNRTYGTNDRARLWVDYQNIASLDFRVYRINDPVKFFKQLEDPHQIGEEEKEEVAASHQKTPSFLEKLHAFKSWIYGAIKDYFRLQLRREARKAFNQKFRGESERDRVPLNVADYARVPLLNPDQLVTSWRELLPPLEDEYDRRMISLGKREPGVYLIEAVNGELRAYSIAIITDLVMVNKTSPDGEMFVYAVDRRSGAPREGVSVEIVKNKKTLTKGSTDKYGMLSANVLKKEANTSPSRHTRDSEGDETSDQTENNAYLVMATDRDDFAISDLAATYSGEGGEGDEGGDPNLTAYIYTDRPVYRPEQKVYFKGILRRLNQNRYEMIGERTVNVTIQDPNGETVFDHELPLTPRGTFNGEVSIASGAPLGSYTIEAHFGDSSASGNFEVQEYKKPEYKVKVSAPEKFVPVGQSTRFTIEASYFFGSPVAGAQVKYYIYRSRYYHYWWSQEEDESDDLLDDTETDDESASYGYGNDMVKDGEGRLDANGRLEVDFQVPPPDEKEAWDYTYRLEAQVTDASRRTIDGSASFTGTRGRVVADATTDRYVYYLGDNAKIKVRTADYEGRPVAAQVTLDFIEHRYEKIEKKDENGKDYFDYELKERELSQGEVTTNAQGEASYDYTVQTTGSIYIKTIVNEEGKQIVSNGGYLWAADPKNGRSDYAYENEGSIKLIPDKKSYRSGETAHVLALLPTDKAHLLVTTELANIMTRWPVDSPGRSVMIDVPVEDRYEPNIYLSVVYVKDGDMYTADRVLAVPAREHLLDLSIIADRNEYKPRETATYTILARNADGAPVPNAEVSVGVVDEAIYQIRPEAAGDIRKEFYGRRYNQVETSFSISYSFNGYSGTKPVTLARGRPAYQLADFKNESQYAVPTIRKEFKDTAFWQPAVLTGADGKAVVKVKLPDNLTTWRATARAVTADTSVGSSLGKVVARKNLILRLETPRFLTEGDTATLSGIVHNYLNEDEATKITIQVTGARLLDSPEQTVTIPKQGEQRVDWRIAAPQVGSISLLAKALTRVESDAVEMPLEVVPHGLRQATGGATAIAEENSEKTFSFNLPPNAEANGRSLRIEVSPSIAGTLFGALDYLIGYPYGCTEQTMSQFLPNVIVAQTLKDIRTASIRNRANLDKQAQRGLERLYDYQHDDGGWGWWKEDATNPFMTAYVIDGLTMASSAGYEVESDRLKRGRDKLKQMLDAGRTDDGKEIDLETRAYMLYALSESGEINGRAVDELFARRGDLQPYGRALLALTLKRRGENNRARQVAAEIENSANVNDFDAHWDSRRQKIGYDFAQVNDIEATALSLKALVRIAPQSELLPKAARWLVVNRRSGHYWLSTKPTAFAIYGLVDYIKVSKELSPDYTVEVYLNGEQVLSRQIGAPEAATRQPLVIERKGRDVRDINELRVVKHGKGIVYLSATLIYFTGAEEVAAQASPNLQLTREYLRLRVAQEGDKASWTIEPLSGDLHSGDLIVARLRVRAPQAQYLMIEDPIPAGCEQVEQVSGINLDYTDKNWSNWYSAREFRDQKTVFFVDTLEGEATYQYALRVQTPGEFRVAPARVELMYEPTVEANTANTRVTIFEKQ